MLARAAALRSAAATATRRRPAVTLVRSFAASSLPPHEVVGLPALSPTMEHGNLANWRLKEGDRISAGDIICQIETDKAVVDFEAQDDMYLAKILVPEGTENIAIGQPIMVTCEEEEHLAGLRDFVLDASSVTTAPPPTPDERPPAREEVAVDPASQAPVVPQDFLVTSQTTHKPVQGTPIPEAPKPTPKPAAPAPAPAAAKQSSTPAPSNTASLAKWGQGIKKSPLSFSLIKKQQAYIDLYGLTGTTPAALSKK